MWPPQPIKGAQRRITTRVERVGLELVYVTCGLAASDVVALLDIVTRAGVGGGPCSPWGCCSGRQLSPSAALLAEIFPNDLRGGQIFIWILDGVAGLICELWLVYYLGVS